MIPAYNEGKSTEKMIDHLEQDFPELDYVVVNGGSGDHMTGIYRKDGCNLLDLSVNLGLASCFQAGTKHAYQKGYRCVI